MSYFIVSITSIGVGMIIGIFLNYLPSPMGEVMHSIEIDDLHNEILAGLDRRIELQEELTKTREKLKFLEANVYEGE